MSDAGTGVSAQARVATPTPGRYVKQLVSHLGRKRTTTLVAPGHGLVTFDDGRCVATAEPGVLVLTANADTAEGLARIQDVVGRHLERFGQRNELRVEWVVGAE
jgi:hypothetical protein